jgi:hypothetical protein
MCLFGAGLATALDHAHATHRVLFYPRPSMGIQAWWVPLLFAGSTLALITQARLFRRPGDGISRALGALSVLDFALAYWLTAQARDFPWLLAAGLAASWLPWAGRDPRRWALGLSVAVAGPLVESALSYAGAFHYLSDQPLVLGVPVWLPGLYLHVSVAARALDLLMLPAPERAEAPAAQAH